MALTGKTIGELELLQFPTNDTLIPVEYIGDTYHITFSSITYNEGTYSQFVAEADNGALTPGRYYLMSDYQTCYDQPNYDSQGMPILVGNYKTGTTEPLLLLAISTTGFSSTVYSELHPSDIITYDINWDTTEVTNSPAKGRINFRIDDQGNAFDYDFREVLFKRYDAYFSEQVYSGTVSITETDGQGIVTGVETNFTNFSTGEIIGVLNINNNPLVSYYEIVSIEDNFNMIVTGSSYNNVSNTRLLDANLLEGMSWKQNNIPSNTASVELPTFGDITQCFNNTSTNTATYTVWGEYTFLLPNNVFKGENTYRDNSFGQGFRNNTFRTSCDSNRVVGSFYNNIFDNDFDNNIINDDFYDNIIDCDFQRNIINGVFYNNHFGDNDSEDFDYNTINGQFYNNFYTGDSDFEYNIINGSFGNNIILNGFSKNTLKGFDNNTIENTFSDNEIGESFYSNIIKSDFRQNTLSDECYSNNFYSTIVNNQIGSNFNYNNIGDVENIGISNFEQNTIGNYFYANSISGSTQHNIIGNEFHDNTIGANFSYNQIRNYFNNNTIADDFGFGVGFHRGNVIGNNFTNNFIGEYFYDNNIGDNFENNSVGEYFQFNRIETGLNNIDFTEYYGNLTGVSFPNDVSGTDGTYSNVTGTTSGNGINAEFEIIVTGNLVTTVNTTNGGKLYQPDDIITIPSGSFGGTADLVLTEDGLSIPPAVYGNYNKTIQRAFNGNAVLTVIATGEGYYPYITPNITQAID